MRFNALTRGNWDAGTVVVDRDACGACPGDGFDQDRLVAGCVVGGVTYQHEQDLGGCGWFDTGEDGAARSLVGDRQSSEQRFVVVAELFD